MAHAQPHPNVVRRRAKLALQQNVINAGQVAAARADHARIVALMAEKAAQARARVPAQRKGPARDARGRFVKASS